MKVNHRIPLAVGALGVTVAAFTSPHGAAVVSQIAAQTSASAAAPQDCQISLHCMSATARPSYQSASAARLAQSRSATMTTQRRIATTWRVLPPILRAKGRSRRAAKPAARVAGPGSSFPDGMIVTNSHVVEDADEVLVKLTDKREFKAKVLGSDKRSDVAVIKIDASGLPAVKVGNPPT